MNKFTATNVPNAAGGFQVNAVNNARWGQLSIDNSAHETRKYYLKGG
jgi:hypothetical protein